MPSPKSRIFWPVLLTILLADCGTKRVVEERLAAADVPHEVLGEAVRLTLAYNPDAAMGLSAGGHSRIVFSVLALGMVAALVGAFRRTPAGDGWRAAALALVIGGALGNLLDRIRSARGVVDFIDLGVGAHRFWTFNVADAGIVLGAALLAVALWRQERDAEEAMGMQPEESTTGRT